MRKKPIDSLELFYKEFNKEDIVGTIRFNNKKLKKFLENGYHIDTIGEFWYDEEGLDYNNWIEEYSKGIWGMTQKEVNAFAREVARKFSHLTRRSSQKVIPRAFMTIHGYSICIYLYMRDRIGCDYKIILSGGCHGIHSKSKWW